jgi:hypothetical protein
MLHCPTVYWQLIIFNKPFFTMSSATHLYKIAIVLLLTACTNQRESDEEVEYQKFVAERHSGVKLDSATLLKLPSLHEQLYEESGLPKFIKNGEEKTMEDMDRFYKDVIIGKYSGLDEEYLKSRFVPYVINYFDLTHSEKPEDSQHLVRLTRELMTNKNVDIRFTYDCLSACKGKIEKNEYNRMVIQAKFEIRFAIENFSEIITHERKRNVTLSKEKERKLKAAQAEMATHTIKSLQSSLAEFEALTIL